MTLSKKFLLLIFILSIFLRFYKIGELYPFIGDQGWFYLSAKDLIMGHIPLVGITASYTWLHQGSLWTYILAPVLLIFNFNPVGGAYLSAILGSIGVLVIYFVGKEMFHSEEVGIISAFILAVAPLDILYSRMPYHTSPIVVCILLFIYFIYKYSSGKYNLLPIVTLMLGLLYNFEIATMVLWPLALIIFLKTKKFDFKIMLLSLFTFFIPMIPMIIYDFKMGSGFYQTTAFPRLIKLSIFNHSDFNLEKYLEVLRDLSNFNQKLIFMGNKFISIILFLLSFIFLFIQILKNRNKKLENNILILGLWILLSIAGILVNKTASEAYLPMVYPAIILMVGYFIAIINETNNNFRLLTYSFIILFAISNTYMLLGSSYLIRGTNFQTSSQRLKNAKRIVDLSQNKKYNLISGQSGNDFPNEFKNYEYLTWMLGNQPSQKNEKTVIIFENNKLYLKK